MSDNVIMNRFSIKDIENLTGIKAHTLRIWEQRYGILQPKRTPTNIRYYDAYDLKHVLRIALLNQYGYKISKIHQMSSEEMNNLIQKINDSNFQLQAQVNKLLEATLDVDTDLFENLIDKYIKRNSVESAVEELLFNFLEKIGIMWMTDRLVPAQEHIASNIIYRKLTVAIERLPQAATESPLALLFLPEGEIHDIGLLYVYYILRKNNKKVIYLGANSPIKDVQYIYDLKRPKYLYTHLTSTAESFDVRKYLQTLVLAMPDVKIFVSGYMLSTDKYTPINDNMHFLYNLSEAKDLLSELS